MEFFMGILVGALVAAFLVGSLMDAGANDFARRSLSCMANGNTIAQCEITLAIPPYGK